MSSTLSRPRAGTATTAVPRIEEVAGAEREPPEREFAGFVKAVGLGVLIGLPLMMAIVGGLVKVAAPDWALGPILGIALWVSIWTGVFLGGTVTVGFWSKRQHASKS
ncbi:MAG: hypothetical protein HYX32_12815 [Actinobacteria bacterium]|nr:hypothetical protein [Actinomycetota bacterium]